MDKIEKAKGISLKSADAEADISMINQHSVKPLKAENVYCFSIVLCDNDVDRDIERFPNASLEAMAKLFVGKPVISNHDWSAEKQIARIYAAEVVDGDGKNALGEPLKQLKARAYMLRNETNQPVIDAIDGGILKEVSIGFTVGKKTCSLCGGAMTLNMCTWNVECPNGHIHGRTYDEGLCVRQLEEPKEAYECSFVPVPAQRNAGVTKGAKSNGDLITQLKEAEFSREEAEDAAKVLQMKMQAADDREAREKILAENKKFL